MKLPAWAEGITVDNFTGDLHLVAQECGVETALVLAEKIGGMYVYVKKSDELLMPIKKSYIRKNREKGIRALIIETRLCETTIRNILREIEADDKQGKLALDCS